MSPVAVSLHSQNAFAPHFSSSDSTSGHSTQRASLSGIPALAARAAKSECPILLTGETGVGKGYLANWIHRHSRRASEPMIAVNCGAVPESIIDSHFFGHARGAFSGADRDHTGLVRAADGGTLFLDEIADLPLGAQSRLLRLLEEREVQPVGHARPLSVNIRVLTATNVDLWQAVAAGRFRKDLFFRLDVISIELPPLRNRLDEFDALMDEFNDEFSNMYQQELLVFSHEARTALHTHSWPGNIRELRSVIERLHVIVGPGVIITPAHLRQQAQLRSAMVISKPDSEPTAVGVPSFRAQAARAALKNHGGNIRTTAIALGVHRSTLYRWLAQAE